MSSKKLDVNFINPFVTSVVETFKVQCSFMLRPGKPFLKGQGSSIPVDLAAVINLKGAIFNGSIAICFPKSVFLAVMTNMLGEKYDEIVPELEDGACELLNIIFGGAKRTLNDKGFAIEKAIPTVLKGPGLAGLNKGAIPTLVLPFETDLGPFQMEITAE